MTKKATGTYRTHALFDPADGILGIGSDKLYELWLVKIFESSILK